MLRTYLFTVLSSGSLTRTHLKGFLLAFPLAFLSWEYCCALTLHPAGRTLENARIVRLDKGRVNVRHKSGAATFDLEAFPPPERDLVLRTLGRTAEAVAAEKRLADSNAAMDSAIAEASKAWDDHEKAILILDDALTKYPDATKAPEAQKKLGRAKFWLAQDALSSAIEEAKAAKQYETAIAILKQAIAENMKIPKTREASELLARYEEEYEYAKQQSARGLVNYGGEWMTPEQARQRQHADELRQAQAEQERSQQEAIQRYVATYYPRFYGAYDTVDAAANQAARLNTVQTGQLDAFRGGGFSGHTGVRMGRYRYTYDQNLRAYVVYQE